MYSAAKTGERHAYVTTRRRRRRWRRHVEGWLFVGPVIFGVCAFQYIPILLSAFASFTTWNGLSNPVFNGVGNYVTLFTHDPLFYLTLRNTIYFTVVSVTLTLVVALGLALLCNLRLPGIRIFRVAYFIPFVTNVVAISFVWAQLYQPQGGAVNDLLSVFHIPGPSWLTDPNWAMPAVIGVSVWQSVGYPMLILLAGLQAIPDTIREAAVIDGARAWNRFFRVILPLLTPSLFFLVITQFISSFQVFGIIYVMTHGGPGTSTDVYIYELYQNAFSYGKMGFASAMAWVLFLIIVIVTAIQWRLQRRWVFYG